MEDEQPAISSAINFMVVCGDMLMLTFQGCFKKYSMKGAIVISKYLSDEKKNS